MGARYGLLGQSLRHSYSPLLHAALGLENYQLFEVEATGLAAFLAQPELAGLNVTIPYKQAVLPYCQSLSPDAAKTNSVNTLIRGADGGWQGHNNDACGLAYQLRQGGLDLAGKKVLIFGSGGAAHTACLVAESQGAREAWLISRSGPDNYGNLQRHADAEILINATPLGMYPHNGELPADPARFPRCQGVADLVYNPGRTAFLLRAEALGLPYIGGLAMLAAQAKAAAELFQARVIPDGVIPGLVRLVRQRTENIVLIGMPGCGKNIVGQALAELSGRPILDTDAWVEEKAGKSIPVIFQEEGEARFRLLEQEAVRTLGKESGVILLTGGGVVKETGNYDPLHQNGRIFHIEREISSLSRQGRPLSLGADLDAMHRERLPLYERFRDEIVRNDGSPCQAAEEIWRRFHENIGD